MPSLLYSAAMAAVTFAITSGMNQEWLKLVSGIPIGVIFYVVLTRLTRSKDLKELMSFVKIGSKDR